MNDADLVRRIGELASQVRALSAESEVRKVLGRYMFLCDAPLPEYQMSEQGRARAISELFTDDAVWEGVGGAHGAQFGQKVGPDAIAEHMARFFGVRNPRLVFNTHYLTTECLVVATSEMAEGTWVQFQPWIFDNGDSLLRSSRLHVRFRETAGGWRICHYRTENLFIADLPVAWTKSLISESVLLEKASPPLHKR